MKTVLVLTDFSENANYAASYALRFAQAIEANLVLCNMFLVPYTEPMIKQVAWPDEDFLTIEDDSKNKLNKLTETLKTELDKDGDKRGFRPAIGQLSSPGSVADIFNDLPVDQNVVMAVISTHNANGFADHAKNIIEKANCPLLVVPGRASFNGFKKIVFATNLAESELDVLHSLYGLTKSYNPEIIITHIADENDEDHIFQYAIKDFYNKLSSRLNYLKLYYKAIKNKSVVNGLNWVTGQLGIDLLVVVHHKRNFFHKIFIESITQKLARQATKPLLIFSV